MAPTDFSKSHDLIVVGAGAAGLAAAARARELGLSTLLLEAKDRIGGRCFTDTSSLGLPWDQGAHWMHQARSNPLVAAAQRLGHRSEEHTSELQSRPHLVCRLLLEK